MISLALDCPALDTQFYYSYKPDKFQFECGWNYHVGDDADGGGVIGNVGALIAWSIYECATACSAMNDYSNNKSCVAVSFNSRMQTTLANKGVNCWLKNATGERQQKADGFALAKMLV